MNLSDYAYIPDYWENVIIMGSFVVSMGIGIYIFKEIVGSVNFGGLVFFVILVGMSVAGARAAVYYCYNIHSLNNLISDVADNFNLQINESVAADILNYRTSDEHSEEFKATYNGEEVKILYSIEKNALTFYKIDLDILTKIDSE